MKIRRLKFTIVIIFIQTSAVFAQPKVCDLRLNVYLLQKTEKPLSVPVPDAAATLVELKTNKLFKAQSVDGNPYFAKISEGKYNLVISRASYHDSFKTIYLNCRLTDEKKIFAENIFLAKGDSRESVEMISAGLGIKPLPPLPLAVGKTKKIVYNSEEVTAERLNERAILLPQPILSSEGEEYRKHLEKNSGRIFAQVYVTGNEDGDVIEAFYTANNSYDVKIFPDILEKAKRAKFSPFKLDGKPSPFSGVIVYTF